MKHNTQFIRDLMDRYDYPKEAKELFIKVLDDLDTDKTFGDAFDAIKDEFDRHYSPLDGKMQDRLGVIAKLKGYSPYTLHFVFLLCLTEELKYNYDLLGIDEKVYYDTMDDLRCKLLECIECEEVPGTFVAGWFNGFFRMERFSYGRFEYEICTFDTDKEFVMQCGKVVHPGDVYVNFHIPSSGVPLTDEVRYNSYKEAYKRVKQLFPDGKVLFGCGSWLLYPRYKEFLPADLNILKFQKDFEIVRFEEKERFGDGWRIFGKDSDLPFEQLPQNTRMRKAFAQWLISGGKTGSAFGLFLFDGEKIVR